MSEEKKVRTIAEIQAEYQNLCTKAGHVNYQIYALKKDLALINDSLQSLNLEAAAVRPVEAAQVEAPKTEEASNG